MTTIQHLDRVFRFGATSLPDPAPDLSPLDALRTFIPSYPFLASAELDEPTVEGDVLVYPVRKPQVQTKGAATTLEDALAAVNAWGRSPGPQVALQKRHHDAFRFLHEVMARPSSPLTDAFLLPLV